MNPLFTNTECQIDGNHVTIDTRTLATTFGERGKLRKPWWVVLCGAFVFPSDNGYCVALVKRTPNAVTQQDKWTIVVAGGAANKHELRNPSLGLEREIYEELVMHQDRERLHPLFVSQNIIKEKMIITDAAIDETETTCGTLYVTDIQAFFMRVYQCKIPIEELVLTDGEYDEINQKYFDREVAIVSLDNLNDVAIPLKMFKGGREISTREINLKQEPTPTMAWFRTYVMESSFR